MVEKPTKTSIPIPASAGTASTSTPVSVSVPSTGSAASTSTVSTTTPSPSDPPNYTVPTPPAGYSPVTLKNYRGYYPKAGQLAAVTGAILELQTTTNYAVFGAGVPSASTLISELSAASRWTAMRKAAELFFEYARSNEAITWKSALVDLDKLDAIFQVLQTQNPAVVAGFPELGKLLDVRKVIGKRGQATRVRNAKEKAEETKAATQTAGATAAAPAANATGATSAAPANGGAH